MQYLLLLYASEAERQRASDAELAAVQREHLALVAELAASGRHGAFHALEHTGAATTLRQRAGKPLVSDGPFAETREQLLGLLLVEARDLDEAIAISGRAPEARLGAVEIRPVREAS